MLANIAGKPLIVHTIERTQKAHLLDALIVTTDSERIAEVVRLTGVPVFMTESDIKTGTDRTIAATKLFEDFKPEIVVTIWGDEPLFPADTIDAVVQMILDDKNLQVACAADRIEESQLAEPSVVKVCIEDGYAKAFSRAPIPGADPYHVIGVMAMRASILDTYAKLPQTASELREGVEQIRLVENGFRIKVHKGSYGSVGVNTPADLEVVRAKMTA